MVSGGRFALVLCALWLPDGVCFHTRSPVLGLQRKCEATETHGRNGQARRMPRYRRRSSSSSGEPTRSSHRRWAGPGGEEEYDSGGEDRAMVLRLWRGVKSFSPSFLSGAYNAQDGDLNPGEALYNMAFVRFPTVLGALWYSNIVYHGGGLTLDLGLGPFTVPPGVVLIVVIALLL